MTRVNDCVTVPLTQCFSLCAALILLPGLSQIDGHFVPLCSVLFHLFKLGCSFQFILKGTVYLKMKILSLFAQPHVVPNPYHSIFNVLFIRQYLLGQHFVNIRSTIIKFSHLLFIAILNCSVGVMVL